MRELKKEAEIIADKDNPVRFYNYSYLKDILEKKHNIHVSLPTIIRRAKNGYYQKEQLTGDGTYSYTRFRSAYEKASSQCAHLFEVTVVVEPLPGLGK